MTHRRPEYRCASSGSGSYLERLSRALPGARNWSGARGSREFWPDGAKLVISISLQFEAGASPGLGDGNGFSQAGTKSADLTVEKLHEYGLKEGIPRLLEVFQRRRVRVTSHMGTAAVERNPELAREIVERGHEAAAHGHTRATEQSTTPDKERACYAENLESIRRVTGTRPIGFHALGLRTSSDTLQILQELGFLYHGDDVSRDEPFLVSVQGKPFVVVPYTMDMNDLVAYPNHSFTSEQYASELRNEFEMLYTEAESRRRMMSISAHDRIAGRPAHAKVLEEFIIYAQRRPGVVFMRKDDIARFALTSAITPREDQFSPNSEQAA
jgi:peptidoglycan/xylan/chitin deacetylase (PgdA/CDA1 family)